MKIMMFLFCMLMPLLADANVCGDDGSDIVFRGDHIVYNGERITLDAKNLYVDGRLSAAELHGSKYAFTSFNDAVMHLTAGTSEADRMTVYVAPYVYWIDNPDDPAVRMPATAGEPPFGLVVDCPWLKIVGLSDNPEDVVLASNRGQAQGAVGNFTMFKFKGDGISLNNVTLGNYCNVDLAYPADTSLNREKRSPAVTQAQLAFADGDRLEAHNVRFVSRLNTCPLNGGRRTLFERCYFESTDDALCGNGVYQDCTFMFYGSRPIYSTSGTGAVFLNCDFHVMSGQGQYLTKVESPVTLVDCRFHSDVPVYLGWTPSPSPMLRCYQSNVTCDGRQVTLSPDVPGVTVDITDKPLLRAYKITHGGKTVYNTYNLLRGNDGWDPMNVKHDVMAASKAMQLDLSRLPVSLALSCGTSVLEAGRPARPVSVKAMRHNAYDAPLPELGWLCDTSLLKLDDVGGTKYVSSVNTCDSAMSATLCVTSAFGLEAAMRFMAYPSQFDAPAFIEEPVITCDDERRVLLLNYSLDSHGRADQSDITWYRLASPDDTCAIPVKVSRDGVIAKTYHLTANDVGYYIAAGIRPKHVRSLAGDERRAIYPVRVSGGMVVPADTFYTDFTDFPVTCQPKVLAGCWTVDGYKPSDTSDVAWQPDPFNSWCYGEGLDGARGYKGLMQTSRGARLMFTPARKSCGDMAVELVVAPCKQAGQGFGSPTKQYMDVCLKFDTRTLTGYGLRIIRTTKYHNAVDFVLVKYANGVITPISEPVTGICYLPECSIRIDITDGRLTAHVATTSAMRHVDDPRLHKEISLSADVGDGSHACGVCIQHTGSGGANATVLTSLEIIWR